MEVGVKPRKILDRGCLIEGFSTMGRYYSRSTRDGPTILFGHVFGHITTSPIVDSISANPAWRTWDRP